MSNSMPHPLCVLLLQRRRSCLTACRSFRNSHRVFETSEHGLVSPILVRGQRRKSSATHERKGENVTPEPPVRLSFIQGLVYFLVGGRYFPYSVLHRVGSLPGARLLAPNKIKRYHGFESALQLALESRIMMLFRSPLLVVASGMVVGLLLPPTLKAQHPQSDDPPGKLSQSGRNNLESILASVNSYKEKCKFKDVESCDSAADLARKGLALTKPDAISETDWRKATHDAFPMFHSAIALDDMIAKHDYKDAELQYTEELKLLSDEESRTRGLNDCVWLATAYTEPGDAQDLVKAVWLFARAYDFVPSSPVDYKAQIEPRLGYYYRRYHGTLDGGDAIKQRIDAIKAQAQNSVLPPDSFTIAPAPSIAEVIHQELAQSYGFGGPDRVGNETVLALGYTEDADKIWGGLYGQQTFVPGIVVAIKTVEIKIAVTPDAKEAHVADFLVNMKNSLTESQLKSIQPGFQFKVPPDQSLVATFDSYKRIPASGNRPASVEIVLKDGAVVPAKTHTLPENRRPQHVAN
jgi:hypothetical protein